MSLDGWFYSGRDGTASEEPLYSFYPVSHPSNRGILHIGIVVFSLAFAIRDSAKLSVCFGMLELSCLGYKSGSKASDCI